MCLSKKANFLRKFLPSRFWLEKIAQFCVILAITVRALHISFLNTEIELNAHLYINPLVISVMTRFRFLNGVVLRCTCLLTFFLLYVDYSLYFRLDGGELAVANEIMVENGQNFVQLNSGYSGDGKPIRVARFWLQALFNQIWNSSKHFNFYKHTLISFPALSIKLRAQLAVCSAITEMLVVIVNIAICKMINLLKFFAN